MDISPTLYKGFLKQYGTEVGNYSMYQNLANVAGNFSWGGFEKFFQAYALDEITHAQKIADFIIGRNRTPVVETIPNPNAPIVNDPIVWFQFALGKAQTYTTVIKDLYRQCGVEKDESAQVFLHWYLSEQDRVERILTDFTNELTGAGSKAALLVIDARLR